MLQALISCRFYLRDKVYFGIKHKVIDFSVSLFAYIKYYRNLHKYILYISLVSCLCLKILNTCKFNIKVIVNRRISLFYRIQLLYKNKHFFSSGFFYTGKFYPVYKSILLLMNEIADLSTNKK